MQNKNMDFNIPAHEYTGFSAAGTDFRQTQLKLDELIIKNPAATFFLRAEQECNLGGYIHCGDILVVDRAAELKNQSLVVAVVNEEMVLRLIKRSQGRFFLFCSCSKPGLGQETEFQIWGKVIYVLHPVLP